MGNNKEKHLRKKIKGMRHYIKGLVKGIYYRDKIIDELYDRNENLVMENEELIYEAEFCRSWDNGKE